jgi:hypothetical protein
LGLAVEVLDRQRAQFEEAVDDFTPSSVCGDVTESLNRRPVELRSRGDELRSSGDVPYA